MRKIVLIKLLQEVTYSVASDVEKFYVLDAPMLTDLGPMIEQIRAHTFVHEANGNINVRVLGRKSFDGSDWTAPPFQIQGPLGSANLGYTVGSAHTNPIDYGLKLRPEIGVKLTSGTTLASVVVSVWLEVQLKS